MCAAVSESLGELNVFTDMHFTFNDFVVRTYVLLLIVFANVFCGLAEPHPSPVPTTPMEAALDALRARFPNQIIFGLEELWDVRPESEPQVDLGPPASSLEQVLDRIRQANPKYKVDLLEADSFMFIRRMAPLIPQGCSISGCANFSCRQTTALHSRCSAIQAVSLRACPTREN